MRPMRMLAGAVVLAAPGGSFLAAFGDVLPWPVWAGVTLACIALGAAMSYYRLPLPSQDTDALS